MGRVLNLINEHIIDTPYTLPSHWRVSRGFEWGAHRTCYVAFHTRANLETDAYLKIEDAVMAAWGMDQAARVEPDRLALGQMKQEAI